MEDKEILLELENLISINVTIIYWLKLIEHVMSHESYFHQIFNSLTQKSTQVDLSLKAIYTEFNCNN